jgi:hypothetical protein
MQCLQLNPDDLHSQTLFEPISLYKRQNLVVLLANMPEAASMLCCTVYDSASPALRAPFRCIAAFLQGYAAGQQQQQQEAHAEAVITRSSPTKEGGKSRDSSHGKGQEEGAPAKLHPTRSRRLSHIYTAEVRSSAGDTCRHASTLCQSCRHISTLCQCWKVPVGPCRLQLLHPAKLHLQ